MSRILVISARAIEYSTSSIICLRSLIDGLSEDNEVSVIAPHPVETSKYYVRDFTWNNNQVSINYYDGQPVYTAEKEINETRDSHSSNGLKYLLYKAYKKIDIFGKAILDLKYADTIIEMIKNVDYDYMISASDPIASHILANKIKKKRNDVFYIQYWGDPLAMDISASSALPYWLKLKIEKRILSHADKVVYVSPLTLLEQKKCFSNFAKKMFFVPTPTVPTTNRTQTLKKKNTHEGVVLGYFGNYDSNIRNILPLYNAVMSETDIELYLIGDSNIELENNSKVHVLGRISPDKLTFYMDMCDVLVDVMNIRGTQIPAKIYRDAGTNKEVLILEDGDLGAELKNFLGEYDRYTFTANNEESIVCILNRYKNVGVPNRKPVTDFFPIHVAREVLKK